VCGGVQDWKDRLCLKSHGQEPWMPATTIIERSLPHPGWMIVNLNSFYSPDNPLR
jgi:hypothetical protein